jgi:ubiquinone/menaquinone biosynthesis C-methylase UbiE
MFTPRIYENWMQEIQLEKIKGILARVKPKGRVLDLGCGAGFLERFLPGAVALDIDLGSLRKVRGLRVLADAAQLPFKDAAFDTVFCIDFIHLFKKTGELTRVLSKHGRAVVTLFCNEYTKTEKLRELKSLFRDMRVRDEFFVGGRELDAVVVLEK